MGVLYVFLSYGTRIAWKKYLIHKMAEGGEHSLYIVTNYDYASKIIQNVKEYNYNRYNINGLIIVDKDAVGREISGIPVVADLKNAASYICQQWGRRVLFNIDEPYSYPDELIQELLEMGMVVHVNLAKVKSAPGQKTVCRNCRRIYSSDNYYELCYRQAGICQKSAGYPGRTCRMFPDRHYLYFCGTGYLHQFARPGFFFTDTNRSEWKAIQDV